MADNSLFAELKERRVIRATLIYVAVLWVALQVADLLAGAAMLSVQQVRWIILLGVAGLPITILASWFLEAPWKRRRWLALAGDIAIIAAVTVAVALFAWRQWFTSFTRPTIAVLKIEATDTRTDSEDLAAHLALRLRTALATRPELRVVELESSQNAALDDRLTANKAATLNADYLLTGTVAQNTSQVRLNLQLFYSNGELVFSESYDDRLLDLAQLQNRVLGDLWKQLPLNENDLAITREVIADCNYPDDRATLLAIAAADNDKAVDLGGFTDADESAGMLQLAIARQMFRRLLLAQPVEKPVLLQLAMRTLVAVEQQCPGLPDTNLLRLLHTREPVSDEVLSRYPNSAALYYRASEQRTAGNQANALLDEARLLDPLHDW